MSNWKFVLPAADDIINYITNPSFEVSTTGWTATGAAALSRDASNSVYGAYNLKCVFSGGGVETFYTPLTLTANTTHYLRFYYNAGFTFSVSVYDTVGAANVYSETGIAATSEMTEYTASFTTAAGSTSYRLIITCSSGSNFYLDGVQVAQYDYEFYIDGDQFGCAWRAAPHNSTSYIPKNTRLNGIIKDFATDYYFQVSEVLDIGTSPLITLDNYATQDGGRVNSIKDQAFILSLIGVLKDNNGDCNVNAERRALLTALSHDTYPQGNSGWEPVTLIYDGDGDTRVCYADLDGGLSGDLQAALPGRENLALRFLVADGKWHSKTQIGYVLDLNDAAEYRYISGRFDGQWSNLAQTSDGGPVYSIVYNPFDGLYYVGFNGVNWDGNANQDYITSYNPLTATWEDVGGAAGINGAIYDMAVDAEGNVYMVGVFTDGAGNKDYVMMYDGAAFQAVGNPTDGSASITSVNAVAIDKDGNVWVGGNFTNFANMASGDYVAYWNGVTWNSAATGMTASVLTLMVDSDNNVWAGGSFTQDGAGNTTRYITYWDGTSWDNEIGSGFNGTVRHIIVDDRTNVYVCGDFTENGAGTVTELNRIAKWNGTIWEKLGTGITNGAGYRMALAPDGMLWVVGSFNAVGDLTELVPRIARWNGSTWLYTAAFVSLAGLTKQAIAIGPANPTNNRLYPVMVGFDDTTAGTPNTVYGNGKITVTNTGNKRAFPQFKIKRTGTFGSRFTLSLRSIRNETSGDEIFLDYSILLGEELTIDTDPERRSVTSNFKGRVTNALRPGSDLSAFCLYPGDNDITVFVWQDGLTPVNEGVVIFNPVYKSFD